MNILTTTKNKTRIELNEGRNGNGQPVYIVATERTGSQGQAIKHAETFASRNEAEAWIKYAI